MQNKEGETMKILASDFDETIYYLDNNEQNKKNIEAINKFVEKGNIFCIVTGRNYTDLKELIEVNKIPYNYLVCEDGAKLFDKNDNCLATKKLSPKTIKELRKILNTLKCNYHLDNGYNETEDETDVVKIVIKCTDEETKNKIVNQIKKKADVHIYASRFHVNIINKFVNKKYGLKKLIELENLDTTSLYTIGDNDNDYEMLQQFNGGVIKKHHKKLDSLNKKEYISIEKYIEELMKD